MANVGDLVVHIKGDSASLDNALNRSSDRMKKMGGQFRSIGKKMMLGVTMPIMGIAGSAIHTAAQFEKSMNRVSALSGATGKDLDALRDQSRELGRTTVFAATEAAEAQGFLAMAGFKTTEILGAMPSVLNLAAAGQLDIARTADIASNIMSGYGLTTEELGHANDVLAKAMTSANVDMEMLGESMKMVAPIASSAGMGFEDVTAAIALMGNAGIQGTMAGTSLRFAIGSLLDPVDDVAKELKRLGITTKDAEGNLLPFLEIVEQLESSGANTSSMLKIFGQRAGAGMSAIVGQGTEALRSMQQSLIDAGGTAKEVADVQMKGLSGEMKEFTSAMESSKIELGNELLPLLTELLNDHLTPLIQSFSDLDEETKKFIVFGSIIAAAVAPLMMMIGLLMPLLAFLFANPIGLALIGIALAIGLIFWALKDWEGMQRTINGLWEDFGDIVKNIFGEETWKNFSRIVEGVVLGMVSLIKGIWSILSGGGTGEAEKYGKEMWGHFGRAAGGVFDTIWELFKFLIDNMGRILLGKERWEKFKDIFIPIFKWIGSGFAALWEGIAGAWSGLWQMLRGVFRSENDLIVDGIKQMVNAVTGILNSLIGQVNKLLPKKLEIPKFGKFETIMMKEERKLNAATAYANVLSGDEFRSQSPSGWRGRGGEVQSIQNITVNVQGDTYGMDDFDAKVSEAIKGGIQRGGFEGVID
jgi:TP901 family phage tail tape measure protein